MLADDKYFESLRKEYPKVISKDQFYRIAHISKATALYLLQEGLVPCRKSGKKTRCYQIRMDDVIRYLMDRELHPEWYRADALWYKERSRRASPRATCRIEPAAIDDRDLNDFRHFLETELKLSADLLSVKDVSSFTGYCETTIRRWCGEKLLRSFRISGKIRIPKECLVDFLLTPYCRAIHRKPWKHLLLIHRFLSIRDSAKQSPQQHP